MQQLRIGIDGYHLAMHQATGVAAYGFALAQALRASGHRIEGVFGLNVGEDPALREVLFYDLFARPQRGTRSDALRLVRDAAHPFLSPRVHEVPITDRVAKRAFADRLPIFDRLTSSAHLFDIAHRHFRLYRRFVRLRLPDPPPIMHWTVPVPVVLDGARNVYTLHDPVRVARAAGHGTATDDAVVRGCIAQAAHICTVSEASRASIVDRYGLDPARVTNSGHAAPIPAHAFADNPADDAAAIAGIFGLPPQGYLLCVGARQPDPTLGRLIEAYLGLGTATPLVIVGTGAADGDDASRMQIASAGAAGRIVRLDRLPRMLLLRLVRSARAVAVTSPDADAGMVVLEAMQLGTPVLTSPGGTLAEVAGQAAIAVDPDSVAALADGLRALDADAALRARLSAAGLAQVAAFSEERYRVRLDAMYANVLARA